MIRGPGSFVAVRMVAPLRKVIKLVEVTILKPIDGRRSVTSMRELLECGHVVPIKKDIYGHTVADRRRCKKCERGAPVDHPGGSDGKTETKDN